MRKLVVGAFVSLDGVMQAPGGPEEDPTGGFTLGGWTVNYWDDSMNEFMADTMGHDFDLLLGRKTYEIFAATWPHVNPEERAARGGTESDIDDEAAAALNNATKYVASRTLTHVDWQNSNLLEGDVAEAVAALKDEDGPEIQVSGSSDLIQTLLRHGLVDEFRLMIFPVVLGSGKRLFADGAVPGALTLRDVKTSSTGVIMATYTSGGEIETGSFAFEIPTDEEVDRRAKLQDETTTT
jgi:dihydrofolate reductase